MTDNNLNGTDIAISSSERLKAGDKVGLRNFFKSKRNMSAFIAVIAAVAVIAVMMAIIFKALGGNDIDYAVVYSKGGDVLLKTDSFEVDLQNKADGTVSFSHNGRLMIYSAVSQNDENTYDLYCCRTNKKKSIESGGSIVVSGVSKDFRISSEGKYLIYSTSNGSKSNLYSYNIDKESTEEISTGVDTIYYTRDANVFFTKTVDGEKMLMRFCAGQVAEQLAASVKDAKLFETDEASELIFETAQTDADVFSLKKVSVTGGVTDIADNVVSVEFDNYTCGGSLYYFKKSETEISWRSLITDENFETDKELTEPDKEDFKISQITLFGISAYDLIGYNMAVQEYKDKLKRDEMRVELDKLALDEGLFLTQYVCYAFDGTSETMIADGVSPENICAYFEKGTPRIIYKHTEMKTSVENTVTLDSLIDNPELYGDNFSEYALGLINSSLSEPELLLSNSLGGGESIKLSEFDTDNSQFYFSDDGSALFALVKDPQGEKSTLYLCSITQNGISEKKTIDTNVTQLSLTDSGLFFLKIDENKDTGSLFILNASGPVKIHSGVSSFIDCDEDVIFLSKGDEGSVDAYIYSGGDSTLLAQNVSIRDILYSDSSHIVYLSNKAAGSQGELFIYTGSGKIKQLDSNVTKILNIVVD